MRKIQIAICATAALGLCLVITEGASAFPAADSSDKAYTQTVDGKSAATPVRWAGRAGVRGVGFRRGVGLGRGYGWRRVGLGRGYGWRRAGWRRGWGWRRVGWRRGYYGGWGGYGLGLGFGFPFGFGTGLGYGGGYAPATYGGCYSGCGCHSCGCGGLF